MVSMRDCDLAKLNSLTKYPSIPTYHAIGDKGILKEEPTTFDGPVILTEKIDGTNSRIILLPDGNYILGSREELLYAKGDLIGNPALGIAEALKPVAEDADIGHKRDGAIYVLYFELYGGKVTAASKQYTSHQQVAWRLFDAAAIENAQELMSRPLPAISSWRENGGQQFWKEDTLQDVAEFNDLQLTPRIATLPSLPLQSIAEAHRILEDFIPRTLSALDDEAGQRPEGLVIRTPDRKTIAKLRFEDYERTARARKK